MSRSLLDLASLVQADIASFHPRTVANTEIIAACEKNSDVASCVEIGKSEKGRAIIGVRLGTGRQRVSLLAGAHSDEPVGPETLGCFVSQILTRRTEFNEYLSRYSFFVVPHVNPDGEARNRRWIQAWPSLEAYLEHAFREPPGKDVEFCYPARRQENRAVSRWMRDSGPFDLHMSLHGMGFSDGALLLIERNWTYRTDALQNGFVQCSLEAGLRMHDHNRKGEKGFFYIAPGFTTTPEGAAMRTYFHAHDQPETAALFGDSSMEYVRSLGGDPLCMVTELPLFVVEGPSETGVPTTYLAFKSELPDLRAKVNNQESLSTARAAYGLRPLPIEIAVALQLSALDLALNEISPTGQDGLNPAFC